MITTPTTAATDARIGPTPHHHSSSSSHVLTTTTSINIQQLLQQGNSFYLLLLLLLVTSIVFSYYAFKRRRKRSSLRNNNNNNISSFSKHAMQQQQTIHPHHYYSPSSSSSLTQTHIRVNIVGAGVAGLALARALNEHNKNNFYSHHKFIVKVFERSHRLSPVAGTGFSIQSSGLLILKDLMGFSQEFLDEQFQAMHTLDQYTADGSLLGMVNITAATGSDNYALAGTLRANLVKLLSEGVQIHFDKELESCETRSEIVVSKFTDGTIEESEILVGADGIRSTVRTQLFGYSDPIFSGHAIWQGVSRMDPDSDLYRSMEGKLITQAGRGFSTGMYCAGNNGDVVFWKTYNSDKVKSETYDCAELNRAKAKLYYSPDDIAEPFPSVIRDAERIMHFGLYYRPPLKDRWHEGRTILIGDAAHPIPPYLGQGANMALEDAALLAKLLSDGRLTIEHAFKLFYEKREPQTTNVLTMSMRMGKFQLAKSSVGCFLRDTLLWLAHKIGLYERGIARQHASYVAGMPEYLIEKGE